MALVQRVKRSIHHRHLPSVSTQLFKPNDHETRYPVFFLWMGIPAFGSTVNVSKVCAAVQKLFTSTKGSCPF
jgi:hypothetical protein